MFGGTHVYSAVQECCTDTCKVHSGVFSVLLTTWVVCTMGMSERCEYVCTN